MSKILHILCFSLFAMAFSQTMFAQGFKDPTHWTYETKKISNNEYELSFNLKLDEGWHIWSINVGGDGYQIVPTFTFDKMSKVNWVGSIKENGTLINEVMEGVEGRVYYYGNNVKYTQIVKGSSGTTITGKHQYQVCNDMMCLPPKDLSFSFQLK